MLLRRRRCVYLDLPNFLDDLGDDLGVDLGDDRGNDLGDDDLTDDALDVGEFMTRFYLAWP